MIPELHDKIPRTMAQLKQIQIVHHPVEDRLLMRLSSTDRHEFRFWLTRRYVGVLWSVLQKVLSADPQVRQAGDVQSRQTIMAFQHETAVQQANFAQPFEADGCLLPMGEVPVLLARVQLRQNPEGLPVLSLHPDCGQGIDLALGRDLAHGVARLLVDAVQRADWALDFVDPLPDEVPANQVTLN